MPDGTILDKILTQKHAHDIRSFDPVVMVDRLLQELPEREREVVARRFGLVAPGTIETLEEIGARLQVTRERIRQITKGALIKLRMIAVRNDEMQRFMRVVDHILRSYGGVLEEHFFLQQLFEFAGVIEQSERQRMQVAMEFLLNHVLEGMVERRPESDSLRSTYALSGMSSSLLDEAVQAFVQVVDAANQPLSDDALLVAFRQTECYRQRKAALVDEPVRAAREFAGATDLASEPTGDEEARVLIGYATAAATLDRNIFGEWGRAAWSTIHPRRMNDKIYLILRREGKPLHFTEISDRVNAANFDSKVAKPPSVHNELILDKRFVLVGRGLYALREWGFVPGTVADVISDLLQQQPGGMTREAIVDAVLSRRMVKRQTIHLALMNRRRFERTAEGRYRLHEEG